MPTITVEPYKILQRRDGVNYPLNDTGSPGLVLPGASVAEAFVGYVTEVNASPRRATASIWYDLPIPAGAYIVSAGFANSRQLVTGAAPYRSFLSARKFGSSDGNPNGDPVVYTGPQPNWLNASATYRDYSPFEYVSPALSVCTAFDGSQTRDLLQQVVFNNNWQSGNRCELHLDGQFLATPGQYLARGLVVVDAALQIEYVEQPAALFGDAFRELSADVQFGERFVQFIAIAARADGEFASTTREGRLIPVDADGVFGAQFASAWRQRVSGQAEFGDASVDRLRYVVQLRLKAGMVDRDVGYMWVPVYLQLPDDPLVADWPWAFFDAAGRKIPFLIRQEVDRQVRALVYMRPSVSLNQDLFVRVG